MTSKILNSLLKFKFLRKVLWFIFGVLLGIGFYELALADLECSGSLSTWLGLTLCLVLAVGNAISIQIRCISLLTLPSICGRAGRRALKALVLTFILAGPIKNLTINAHEVVRVFSCSTELTYNLTKTRFDLMYKPFQEALFNMKGDITAVKDTMKAVNGVIRPLSSEIEDDSELNDKTEENDYIDEMQGDSKRSVKIEEKYKLDVNDTEGQKYEKEYLKKLETRCEEVITHGTERCHKMFKEAYNRCYDKVSWMAAWLLCWPMKLTYVCNLAGVLGGGAGTCDATKEVEPGFGESFAAIKVSGNLWEGKKGQTDGIKIKYESVEFDPPLNVADAKEAAESLEQDFNSKKSIFDNVSIIIRRLLSIIFLKVLIQAQKYHDKYLEDFNHDNNWVTSYFHHIDERRQAVNKMTLLPFKKAEKVYMCSPTALLPRTSERKAFLFETGKHDLVVKIKGTGMMARLVRSVLDGFNVKQEVFNERSNFECLPNPNEMCPTYLRKIYGTYFIIWILIFLEAYSQRLKRVICSSFYPKREKQRVLFIYNQNLKKRANYLKRTANEVKERAKEEKLSEKINLLLYLRCWYPKHFGWLRNLTVLAQRRCLICDEHEGQNGLKVVRKHMEDGKNQYSVIGTEKLHVCATSKFPALYCIECWQDVGSVCYVCSTKDYNCNTGGESRDEEPEE